MLRRTILFLDRNFSHEQPRTNKPQPSQRNSVQPPLRAETPLEGFFSRYPDFKYKPSSSPKVEFDRLCELLTKPARDAFSIALKEEFNHLYGLDERDIKNWHKLCHVLRIRPAPKTPRKCRAVSYRSSDTLPLKYESVYLYTGRP